MPIRLADGVFWQRFRELGPAFETIRTILWGVIPNTQPFLTQGGFEVMPFAPIHSAMTVQPDLRMTYENPNLVVELIADVPEWIVTFGVTQAIRLTAVDAYSFTERAPDGLAEVVDSTWIDELTATVGRIDKHADFMAKSHHYLLLGMDDVLEVACWTVTVRDLRHDPKAP